MSINRWALCLGLLLAGAAVGFAGTAMAQTFQATLTGVVTDVTGAILPGVTVTASHQQTNVQTAAVTNEAGIYTLLNLSPGAYQLRAELPGFKVHLQSGIVLEIEQTGRLDIRLEVGELTENVEVVAQTPLLNTETSSKGQVVTHDEIIDLPLEGRDFNELAYLTPGVVPVNQGGQGGFANINGARADSINFMVEGGNNNILRGGAATARPALDAIQEFKVQTSNYSAEYGRRSTGVINMVLRSGSNDFHGTLFNFHRNHLLDARNFFDQDKSKLIRNNFGGNLGGPVMRDRFFFFFNFEGMRRREGQPRLGRVATPAEREGDFAAAQSKIRDPLTGKNFNKNRLPQNRFHPAAVKILEFYPLPNFQGPGGLNYFSNKIDADDFNDYTTKWDYHFGEGDSISFRYIFNDRDISNPFAGSILPGFGNVGTQAFQLAGVTYSHMFTPALLNQTIVTFARKNVIQHAINWKTDYAGQFGIPGVTKNPDFFGFPRIQIQGYAALGDDNAMPLDWTENDYQVSNLTTLLKGSHNIRFGGEVIRTQFFQLFANQSRGVFNFLGRWTREPFADFLLGMLNNTTRRVRHTKNYLFSTTYAGYFQDDWKLRRNLTVNLGIRYDLFLPPTDKFGNWSNFVPEAGRLVLSGEENFPRALVYTDRNNLAPRLGFAWRPWGKNTVIRAGYGTFFGLSLLNPLRTQLGANPPFTIRETYSRNTQKPLLLTFSDPFPPQRTQIADVNTPNGYELRAKSANLHQYNFTIERQFSADTVLEVGYVGTKGTHLGRQFDLNQPFRSADLQPPFPRRFPGFGGIDYFAFEADSNYHSLQASLRKRGRGLNYRINYVLSKSIDDASRISGRSAAGFAGAQDVRNRHLERGLSDFDVRHAWVGSVIYRLPFGRGGRAGSFLVKDWQINSIVRVYSGTPITPQLANFDFNAGEAKRPDRIGSGVLDKPGPERWFQVADFVPVLPGAFRFGNSGRNILIGPNQYHWSFSAMRHFNLPNEHRLQVRWEVFNIPNFTNFLLPEENIDIPTAGVISQAAAARQMQVALKYIF